MDENWANLTKEEKREKRIAKYLSGEGISFRDARARQLYKERVTRLIKVSRCQEPDRVPVSLPIGYYPVYYAGFDFKTAMYDAEALKKSYRKFMNDFYEDMDTFMGPGLVRSGQVLDIADYKNYAWPGHGLCDDATTFQFVEAVYMNEDEYDWLIKDPSDYLFRVLTPRTMGSAEGLQYFTPLSSLMSAPLAMTRPFARKEVRDSFKKLIAAGEAMEQWNKEVGNVDREVIEAGFPAGRGGLGICPFDLIGDFMRGTKGIAIDMFRRPEQLMECLEIFYELTVPRTIEMLNATGGFSMVFPLHRGDDRFMSRKHFEKFYWPTLKRYIDALIEEGIQVSLFAEGAYNERLEYIGDFPKGWVSWMFDQTDMANAKKMIGDRCAISGNVPASLMVAGTPGEVEDCCCQLIESCAPGGGYTLAGGCSATETKNPENFRAFMRAARKYGTY